MFSLLLVTWGSWVRDYSNVFYWVFQLWCLALILYYGLYGPKVYFKLSSWNLFARINFLDRLAFLSKVEEICFILLISLWFFDSAAKSSDSKMERPFNLELTSFYVWISLLSSILYYFYCYLPCENFTAIGFCFVLLN